MHPLTVTFLLLMVSISCLGQPNFKGYITKSDSINSHQAREKIFIHYDRLHYSLEDTLWARGYIVNAQQHTLNDSSRFAYIEIIDPEGKIIHRSSAACLLGQFDASIPLKAGVYSQGTYLIRAYTRWMRNFGDSLFYESHFKILNFKSPQWQTRIKHLSFVNNHLQLKGVLTPITGPSPKKTGLQIILRSNRKKNLSFSGTSDMAGNFYLDTILPNSFNPKNLSLELLKEGHRLITLPITHTAQQPTALQFLPEGGSFVVGVKQRLGFKATDSYGQGVAVKGIIQNNKGAVVTPFSTIHRGMGVTVFTPQPDEQYTAVLENGLKFELPPALPQGIALSVTEHGDSMLVQVTATKIHSHRPLYLAATTRGIAYVRGKILLMNGVFKLSIPKSHFPSGVMRVTIYDHQLLPLNERAAFIWHRDDMKLSMSTQKPVYTTRDSVDISFQIENYKPTDSIAFFSLAVIDTSQVPYNKNQENILSYLLLQSDVKGNIEDPFYYFNHPPTDAKDALMLTQGWVKYNWSTNAYPFRHEKELTVSGKVSNLTHKGLEGIDLLLKGLQENKAYFVNYATTDKNGHFVFDRFPELSDTGAFTIRAFEKNPKAIIKRIHAITLDVLPGYQPLEKPRFLNENLALDTTANSYIQRQVQLKRGKEYLEEVIVKARGKITGSRLIGKPDYVYTDFEEDETFGRFFFGKVFHKLPAKSLQRRGLMVAFFTDGVFSGFDWVRSTDASYQKFDSAARYGFLFLYSMKNDIKAVEVLTDRKSVAIYQNKYGWNEMVNPGAKKGLDEPNFNRMIYNIVEVTTYTGKGPWTYRPNLYNGNEQLYFPLLPVVSKEFYQPNFSTPIQEDALPQLPATVYWKNYLMPDEKGILRAGFYTTDNPKNYVVIVQGINASGKLAFFQQSLTIKKDLPNGGSDYFEPEKIGSNKNPMDSKTIHLSKDTLFRNPVYTVDIEAE